MKNNMRVMKVFDIEKNYIRHKERLMSIQCLNPKQRVSSSTMRNLEGMINYKKSKLVADIFIEKQKHHKIQSQNQILYSKMTKLNHREGQNTMRRTQSKSSVRSFSASMERIKLQNSKFKEKILNTKSNYHNIRHSRVVKISNTRQEVINLLENQLKLKPNVMFPRVIKKNQHIRHINGSLNVHHYKTVKIENGEVSEKGNGNYGTKLRSKDKHVD